MEATIKTFKGEARYIKTEVEDINERWNDNYYINDGYFVIHQGKEHHIYKI